MAPCRYIVKNKIQKTTSQRLHVKGCSRKCREQHHNIKIKKQQGIYILVHIPCCCWCSWPRAGMYLYYLNRIRIMYNDMMCIFVYTWYMYRCIHDIRIYTYIMETLFLLLLMAPCRYICVFTYYVYLYVHVLCRHKNFPTIFFFASGHFFFKYIYICTHILIYSYTPTPTARVCVYVQICIHVINGKH